MHAGRSRGGAEGARFWPWTLIAVAFGLVIPAIAVACMGAQTSGGPRLSTSGASSRNLSGPVEDLQRLVELRASGVLTEAEFDAKKRTVLDGL